MTVLNLKEREVVKLDPGSSLFPNETSNMIEDVVAYVNDYFAVTNNGYVLTPNDICHVRKLHRSASADFVVSEKAKNLWELLIRKPQPQHVPSRGVPFISREGEEKELGPFRHIHRLTDMEPKAGC